MKYTMQKAFIIGLVLTTVFSQGAYGWLSGYTMLVGQRTIHIGHDVHDNVRGVKKKHIKKKSGALDRKLYPTESRFLQELEKLNSASKSQAVDVVWETPSRRIEKGAFISLGYGVVQKHYKNLNLIVSDTFRNRFEDQFLDGYRDAAVFNDPAPLSKAQIAAIRKNSGEQAWQSFSEFRNSVIQGLQAKFLPHFKRGDQLSEDYFEELDIFDSLADVELLSHILASSKQTVIVYAGGWHSEYIVQFLASLGNKAYGDLQSGDDEIDPDRLSAISNPASAGQRHAPVYTKPAPARSQAPAFPVRNSDSSHDSEASDGDQDSVQQDSYDGDCPDGMCPVRSGSDDNYSYEDEGDCSGGMCPVQPGSHDNYSSEGEENDYSEETRYDEPRPASQYQSQAPRQKKAPQQAPQQFYAPQQYAAPQQQYYAPQPHVQEHANPQRKKTMSIFQMALAGAYGDY